MIATRALGGPRHKLSLRPALQTRLSVHVPILWMVLPLLCCAMLKVACHLPLSDSHLIK